MRIRMKISDEILDSRGGEVEALYNLSQLMNTGLDRRVIAILLELLELGVRPDSLVDGNNLFVFIWLILHSRCRLFKFCTFDSCGRAPFVKVIGTHFAA